MEKFKMANSIFKSQIFARHSSNNSITKKIKLVLYTKENCSLCDEAKEFIEEKYPNKFLIEEVDITKNNRELFRKFKLDIPVFYYNGQLLMQHKVDMNALNNLLSLFDGN